jgi:ABC-type sugar transport system substrate-binding protein
MKNISRRLMVLRLCIYGSAAHADNESIALFTKNQTNPYFESVRLGAQSAAKEMHVTRQGAVGRFRDFRGRWDCRPLATF